MDGCQARCFCGFKQLLGGAFVFLLGMGSPAKAQVFGYNPYVPQTRQIQKPFSNIDRHRGLAYADPFATGCATAYSSYRAVNRHKQTRYQQFQPGPTYKRYPSRGPIYGNPEAATTRRVASSRPGSEAYSNGIYTFPLNERSRYATRGDRSSIQRYYPMSAGCLVHGQNGDVYRTASGYWFPLR